MMKRFRNSLFFTLLLGGLLLPSVAAVTPYQPLLHKNEQNLFSFRIQNTDQIMTIGIGTKGAGYLVYRFGTNQRVELEYPRSKRNSWRRFSFWHYLRGGPGNEGLDLNYLTFTNGKFTYTVYQEYSAKDDKEFVGIKIRDNLNQTESEIKGDPASVIGKLSDLRNDKRIPVAK